MQYAQYIFSEMDKVWLNASLPTTHIDKSSSIKAYSSIFCLINYFSSVNSIALVYGCISKDNAIKFDMQLTMNNYIQ